MNTRFKQKMTSEAPQWSLTLTILDTTPKIFSAKSGWETVRILTDSNGASKKQQQNADVAAPATINGISNDDVTDDALTADNDACVIIVVMTNDV